jgi:molybdopterin synthase sulfur carrier subunit
VPAVTVRYFAAAREAAGTGSETLSGETVGAVLDAAVDLHGRPLADVLGASRVWLDGQPANRQTSLQGGEEVAVLPPVSGGSGR